MRDSRRRLTVFVSRVDVCAVVLQARDQRGLPPEGGAVQRRLAVVVGQVDVGAVTNQILRQAQVTLPSSRQADRQKKGNR